MTSQTGKQNNYNTHIAQYLNKGDQIMKFGQFIEYDVRNIVLEKSYNKNKLYKISDCWSRDMLNIDF